MKPTVPAQDERHHIATTLHALGLDAASDTVERLHVYTALLLKWNKIYNLTGAKSAADLLRDHLFDCLAIIPVLRTRIDMEATVLVDIGSGAGLPGIPIALLDPRLPVALVEPTGKKAAFLRQALLACDLPNVSVHQQTMAAAIPALREHPAATHSGRHFDFVSRAFAATDRLLLEAKPLATAPSRLFAMKSQRLDAELAQLPEGRAATIHPIDVPGTTTVRYLAEISVIGAEADHVTRPLAPPTNDTSEAPWQSH